VHYVCIASARTGMCNIFVRLTTTALAGGFPEQGSEDDILVVSGRTSRQVGADCTLRSLTNYYFGDQIRRMSWVGNVARKGRRGSLWVFIWETD
jgi:hypothetical protein